MDTLLCELHVHVKKMEFHREFNEIMSGKNKKVIFCKHYLDMDSSLDIAHIHLKFRMCILEIWIEGRVSQKFDFGLSFYLIKCRIWCIKSIEKVTRFFT